MYVYFCEDVEFASVTFMMKERRIGEWGNNVTRLLYYLEDSEDNIIDAYEYKAPVDDINALLSLNHVVYTQVSRPVDDYFVAYVRGWQTPNVDELRDLLVEKLSKLINK